MSTLEQRRRFAEKIGNRVQGTTGGHLRIMNRGEPCDACGGPSPCFCADDVPDAPPSRGAVAPVADHTQAARQRLAALTGREVTTPPVPRGTGVRMIRSAGGSVAVARADLPEFARRLAARRAAAAQPPIINVYPPDVHVAPPVVNVNPPTVNVAAPAVTVNQPPRASKVIRDARGRITGVEPVETRD